MDSEVSVPLGALTSSCSSRPTPSSLLDLHDDILVQILEDVQLNGTLRALSLTCRDIRTLCMPFLFNQCTVNSRTPVSYAFLPDTVWPYVKNLVLIDRCADIVAEDMGVPLQFAQDPMLCGIYDGPCLENALRNMSQLSSVTFKVPVIESHGLPWSVIAAVLSLPGLQELRISSFLISPKTLPQETIGLQHYIPLPLKSFEYELYDLRSEPRSWPTEKQALTNILLNICTTLEKLTLPTEAVPFKYILSARFPALRELHLRGDYCTTGSPPLSYVQIFANMPRLRCLNLRLGQVSDDPVPPLWPPGLDVPFPWPELEHLTISHPVVGDRIYANLPLSLRSLALRSFPHFATHIWKYGLYDRSQDRWDSFVLLTASQMQSILRELRLPSLEGLEIEYQEDDVEDDLLRYMTSTFQNLTTITIRRTRREDGPDICIENLGQTLAKLARLRIVRLHLDLVDTPQRAWNPLIMFDHRQLLEFKEKLRSVAELLVAYLSPSVEKIVMFKPRASGTGSERVEFSVVRGVDGVHVQRFSYK